MYYPLCLSDYVYKAEWQDKVDRKVGADMES
jgi:hypothetical protein